MLYQTKQLKTLEMPGDLLSVYRHLSQLSGFALLKSDGGRHGNFDIVTALPYQSHIIKNVEDMQNVLPELTSFNEPSLGPFPFQGGMIGYLSYDYGVQTHGIPMPDRNLYERIPIACLNWYRWCIVVDHHLNKATLIYETDADTVSRITEIESLWHQPVTEPKKIPSAKLSSVWHMREYEHAFNEVKNGLKAGRCYQVNLTQPYSLQTSAKPWNLYEHIARNNPVPYGAFLAYDEHQILSFSPECFITVDGEKVTTRPIKGSTARNNDDPQLDNAMAEALLASEKNRAENVMIVDLMRNDLSKIATKGSVQVERLCELESYPDVHHLVSEIVAQKQENLSAIDVLLSAFPGGSITGAPKIEAMKMISELEPANRGPYCGSVFCYSKHGRLDSNIAIRTITALKNEYWLHAGGGIVIDSQLNQEYEECVIKLSAILKAMNIK